MAHVKEWARREYARMEAEEKVAAELATMTGISAVNPTGAITNVDALQQSSKVDNLFAAFKAMPTSTSAVPTVNRDGKRSVPPVENRDTFGLTASGRWRLSSV